MGLFGLRIVEVVYDVDKLFAFNLERFYENIGILETLVTNYTIEVAITRHEPFSSRAI